MNNLNYKIGDFYELRYKSESDDKSLDGLHLIFKCIEQLGLDHLKDPKYRFTFQVVMSNFNGWPVGATVPFHRFPDNGFINTRLLPNLKKIEFKDGI